MRKAVKFVMILATSVLSVGLLLAGFYELHDFQPYLASMRAIQSGMAPEDKEPSQNVSDFVWKVEGRSLDSIDASHLLAATMHPQKMLAWHFHSAMWSVLLPLHFTRKERAAFYCHYLAYENGLGFSNASQFYFGKPPEQLNADEIAAIVAVGRWPGHNSPSRHPDHFKAAKQLVLAEYAR
jgi:predicted DNA-binding transcriptional regulator YafY